MIKYIQCLIQLVSDKKLEMIRDHIKFNHYLHKQEQHNLESYRLMLSHHTRVLQADLRQMKEKLALHQPERVCRELLLAERD